MKRVISRFTVVAVAVVATIAPHASPAVAAIPTQVDVGWTEGTGGHWRGSGSYSNGNGTEPPRG
jgi:hypothetical protein